MSDFRCEGNQVAYGHLTGQLPHNVRHTSEAVRRSSPAWRLCWIGAVAAVDL